jgi:hypothetical protein
VYDHHLANLRMPNGDARYQPLSGICAIGCSAALQCAHFKNESMSAALRALWRTG